MEREEKNGAPTNPKFQALILEISGPVIYLKPSLPQVFYDILNKYWNESTLGERDLPPLTISSVRKAINAAEKWVTLRNHKKGRLMSPFEQERYRKILFSVMGLKKPGKQDFLDQIILQELGKKLKYEVQPGMKAFLESAHEIFNIPIFLIDDWERDFTINLLKQKRLLLPYCHVITSDQVNVAKPHPQFFETLFKSAPRRIRPSRTLYVTDNPHEIPFVKNLGMKLYYLDLPAERGFHVFITPKYLQPPKPLVPVGKELQDLGNFIRDLFLRPSTKQQGKNKSASSRLRQKEKDPQKRSSRARHRAAR